MGNLPESHPSMVSVRCLVDSSSAVRQQRKTKGQCVWVRDQEAKFQEDGGGLRGEPEAKDVTGLRAHFILNYKQ